MRGGGRAVLLRSNHLSGSGRSGLRVRNHLLPHVGESLTRRLPDHLVRTLASQRIEARSRAGLTQAEVARREVYCRRSIDRASFLRENHVLERCLGSADAYRQSRSALVSHVTLE